jgi:hypothetical protein
MRIRIFVLVLAVAFFVAVASSAIIQKVVTVKARDSVNESLVTVNGIGYDLLEVELNGSGSVRIVNNAYFNFKGRIVNLSVEKDDVKFLVERTGNGIWAFYYDNNSNNLLDNDDIKMGEVKIEQGSSSLDGDIFTVDDEKNLKITMRYEPYVEKGDYVVKFEIIPVYERYS